MPTDRIPHSVGLARWRAEGAGDVAPPPELRDLRRRYGWTEQQISIAFEVLADLPVHLAGGRYLISEGTLTSRELGTLTQERLIRLDRDGWALTRKGEELLCLLLAYGDPQHKWTAPAITF
jgi:hypothetical protein